MKKIILGLVALGLSSSFLNAGVYVNGYYKPSSGTYVAPHFRSSPDSYKYNNRSYNGYGY